MEKETEGQGLSKLLRELKTPCPRCHRAGGLGIYQGLRARDLGTWSLPGAQEKVSAREVPVLVCDHCGLRLAGEYGKEDDGSPYAAFDPKDLDN